MLDSAFIDATQIHKTTTHFLTKTRGFGSPMPRSQQKERAQRHGVVDLTRLYGPRILEMQGLTFAPNAADAWRAFDDLKGAFALGTPHLLTFTRAGRLEAEQCLVIVGSALEDQEEGGDHRHVAWSTTLVAADPRFFSTGLRFGQYDPTLSTAGGGAPIPLVFPLVFAVTTASRLELENLGNFPTPPVLTIKGPVINPIVDNDTTSQSVAVSYSLGVSDVVEVDVVARTVKLNGASRPDLYDARNSVWWELVKGTNGVRLRGSGMLTGSTSLSVSYRDARI